VELDSNTHDKSGDLLLYCKGAPEKVASLCAADSVPHDFLAYTNSLANEGYRLIAFAAVRHI
jgi:magnesium-transporting ATPase (P-type)